MSSQDVGHQPFFSIYLPAESRLQSSLPSAFSHTVASIRDNEGTQWIFYYNAQSIICYEKILANGKTTRAQVAVGGKPVFGGPNDSLAATPALDSSVSRDLYILLCCKIQKAKAVGSCFFFFSFFFIWCEANFYFHVKVSNESSFPQ